MMLKPDWATFYKHWSTWAIALTVLFDGLYIFTGEMQSMLSPQTVVLINGLAAVGTKFLTLVKQSIPLAPEVKQAMKENITEAPTAKPEAAPPNRPPQVLTQDQFNALVDERVELKSHKRKPTAPRTKALAEKFTKGHKP